MNEIYQSSSLSSNMFSYNYKLTEMKFFGSNYGMLLPHPLSFYSNSFLAVRA